MQRNWQDIESQFQAAFQETNIQQENQSPVDLPDIDLTEFSENELLQMAYDKIEDEIEIIKAELRALRQKHRLEEERIERRLAKKTATRQQIIDQARG